MKRVIGLIGEMAAGKSTATDFLKTKYNAVTFRFSDALRDVLKRLGIEETRPNLQMLSTILRQNFGEDLLSKAIVAAVNLSSADLIIVEGIRRPSDVKYLNDLPGFKMVYLNTPERTRYERLIKRRENPDDATKTWEQFQFEGRQEAERDIKNIAAQANVTIDNSSDLTNLNTELDKLLA